MESEDFPRASNVHDFAAAFRDAINARRVTLSWVQERLRSHAGFPNGICRRADPDVPDADRSETLASIVIDLRRRRLRVADEVKTTPAPSTEELRAIREYDKDGFWTR